MQKVLTWKMPLQFIILLRQNMISALCMSEQETSASPWMHHQGKKDSAVSHTTQTTLVSHPPAKKISQLFFFCIAGRHTQCMM